jgi:hypothetical protein
MNYSRKLSLMGLVLGFAFIVVIIVFPILSNKFTGDKEQESQKDTIEETTLFFSSLKDAVADGTTMKCSWGIEDLYSGETFIKDRMLYINYKPGWEETVIHVIIKDNCAWEWTQEEKGKKTCLETTEDFYDSNVLPEIQEDRMVKHRYNCVPAEIADSMFEVPENIAF